MINLYVTEDEMHTIYMALTTDFNRLVEERKNPNTHTGQILERQYARCLQALATVSEAVEKNYHDNK